MTSILAVETATEACSAALYHQEKLFSEFSFSPQQHVALILPMCNALLTAADIQPAALSAVGFGRGPGSFTGVRIAAAVTQGIAAAYNLPVIAVSTLQILAQTAFMQTGAQQVIAGLDARMGEIYWAKFRLNSETQLMQLMHSEKLSPKAQVLTTEKGWFYAGSGFQQIEVIYPCAKAMMPIVLNHWQENKILSPEVALPVYLRDNVVF